MPFLAARTERGMSRHEGVSCDACLRSNFRGRRYKCLICYDYDLCAGCHEAGSTTTRHTADHPMQCILTRTDAEVLYGGEALPLEQPRSFVCPHCGRMGFTETSLADHVSAQHSDSVTQVVCPVCASVPSGEPNHITEDLPTHLTVDHHRGGGGGGLSARDLISFGDEPAPAGRQSARRVPHPAQAGGAPRIRRFNTHFRESMDPITELLSQLSGVRRAATLVSGGGPSVGAIGTGTASRLQQLQAQAVRQRGERPARRQPAAAGSSADGSTVAPPAAEAAAAAAAPRRQETGSSGASASDGPQFLLASILDDDDSELAGRQMDRADRSAFVQEVILSTLIDSMDASSICESGGRPAASAAAAASAPSSALASQPSSQKGRDARPAAAAAAAAAAGGPPARVAPPAAGASPVGAVAAAAAARPAAVASRLPAAARPGRGAPQLRASGLVHHPVGVSVAGVRGQRKPPRPAAAAAAAPVDGRPAEPSAH